MKFIVLMKGAVNFRVREAKLLAIRSFLKIESSFFDMLDTLWASLSIPISSQIEEHSKNGIFYVKISQKEGVFSLLTSIDQ